MYMQMASAHPAAISTATSSVAAAAVSTTAATAVDVKEADTNKKRKTAESDSSTAMNAPLSEHALAAFGVTVVDRAIPSESPIVYNGHPGLKCPVCNKETTVKFSVNSKHPQFEHSDGCHYEFYCSSACLLADHPSVRLTCLYEYDSNDNTKSSDYHSWPRPIRRDPKSTTESDGDD